MKLCLLHILQAARTMLCVAALAVLVAEEDEPKALDEAQIIEAVLDFRSQADTSGAPGWVLDTLYSEPVVRWLIRRIRAVLTPGEPSQ